MLLYSIFHIQRGKKKNKGKIKKERKKKKIGPGQIQMYMKKLAAITTTDSSPVSPSANRSSGWSS